MRACAGQCKRAVSMHACTRRCRHTHTPAPFPPAHVHHGIRAILKYRMHHGIRAILKYRGGKTTMPERRMLAQPRNAMHRANPRRPPRCCCRSLAPACPPNAPAPLRYGAAVHGLPLGQWWTSVSTCSTALMACPRSHTCGRGGTDPANNKSDPKPTQSNPPGRAPAGRKSRARPGAAHLLNEHARSQRFARAVHVRHSLDHARPVRTLFCTRAHPDPMHPSS